MKPNLIPPMEKMPNSDDSEPTKSFLSKFACFNPINLFSVCNPSSIYQRLPSRPAWTKPYVNDLNKDPVTQKSLEFVDKRRQTMIDEAAILKKKSDAHLAEYRRLGNKINQTNALNFRRQYMTKMKQVKFLENQWNSLNQMNDTIIMNKTNREVATAIKQGTQELSQSTPDIDVIEDIMLGASEAMENCNDINAQFNQSFTLSTDDVFEMDDEELLEEMNKEFDSTQLNNNPPTKQQSFNTSPFNDNEDIILNNNTDLISSTLTSPIQQIPNATISEKKQSIKIISKNN